MDASQYPALFLVAGVLGWLAGRVTRQFNADLEAYDRAFGALDGYTDSYAQRDALALAGTDRDGHRHANGPGFYLSQYRDARRRTILRDYVGDSSGAGPSGGDLRSSDETAVK